MWYKIDIRKFARTLLPPILRGTVLVALVGILVIPVKFVYDLFTDYREEVKRKLLITGNVQSLEKALNDAFFLHSRQIYIMTAPEPPQDHFYFKSEGVDPIYLNAVGGKPFYIGFPDDVIPDPTFIVYIPHFLCTDLDPERDKYEGKYMTTVYNILNHYKPAGRAYHIELYHYD